MSRQHRRWRTRRRERRRRPGRIRLTGPHWAGLGGFTVSAVLVAGGLGLPATEPPPMDPARVAAAREELAALRVVPARPAHRHDYRREAFGPAWTDAAGTGDGPIAAAGNGCDTRNDVLARDLRVSARTAVDTCATAVAAGRFRSPYTGADIDFRRGRGSTAVQIDHIVALAYAWDMGAWTWPPTLRTAFANDPANLVAVDAASNQAKSDAEPGRWMPPLHGFRCQYAVQFITVAAAYSLPVDAPSRRVLRETLDDC